MKESDILELELETDIRVLGIEPGSSGRATSALNHSDFYPALLVNILTWSPSKTSGATGLRVIGSVKLFTRL